VSRTFLGWGGTYLGCFGLFWGPRDFFGVVGPFLIPQKSQKSPGEASAKSDFS
jgi:hypothetical protein